MLGIGDKRELPTILLIDDDLVSREVIATVLTLHGHLVHSAENGNEALQKLQAGSVVPGVVLMDAQLPGLSGADLIAGLRGLTSAKIILISGSAPPDALVAAADGFLLKPFGPEDLEKLLAGTPKTEEVLASTASEPVVNPDTFAQLRQLMTVDALRELYGAVVTDLHKRSAALETAIAAGNNDEVRRLGHAIKGGCGMAGAVQASRLGALLEANSDQLDYCANALRELYSATQRLERMLEKEFPA
jgi:CheY-like chemotaxis protein